MPHLKRSRLHGIMFTKQTSEYKNLNLQKSCVNWIYYIRFQPSFLKSPHFTDCYFLSSDLLVYHFFVFSYFYFLPLEDILYNFLSCSQMEEKNQSSNDCTKPVSNGTSAGYTKTMTESAYSNVYYSNGINNGFMTTKPMEIGVSTENAEESRKTK